MCVSFTAVCACEYKTDEFSNGATIAYVDSTSCPIHGRVSLASFPPSVAYLPTDKTEAERTVYEQPPSSQDGER